MTNPQTFKGSFTRAEGKDVTLEVGKLAPLAAGSVSARIGDTVILVTATGAAMPREAADFFPLTVDIEERMYAAGKIPGSFFRREARAGEQAILTCRLIDRPLRPAFPDGFRNEVHVVGTVLGADQENPYDVLALNAASLALSISNIPFDGPIGAVRISWSPEGEWIPFPTYQESADSAFEMVVAGCLTDSDVAVMMVEAGVTENSWNLYETGTPKVNEDVLAQGLEASKVWVREMIEFQQQVVDAYSPIVKMDPPLSVDYSEEIFAAVQATAADRIVATQKIADKGQRQTASNELSESIIAELSHLTESDPYAQKQIKNAIRAISKQAVRQRIVEEGIRIDGRGTDDLRNITSEVEVIPTAHGSGLFQRGDTQVLNFTTLGMGRSDMLIDDLSPQDKKRYFHHYNFPPFSTGETGFMRGPKRREIGHGALAERAVFPVIPSFEEWPYTVRTVSEVLASNGSSSMASVCASTLSLMDAGVPIKAPVAGIAMGLVHADGTYVTLTDILGAEDAFGDMDFKVAGTTDFVTALQLDTKIAGIPASVLANALAQAREARLDILDVMAEAIAEPREEVRDTAPKIISFEIPVEKIGEVIGPKGKVINAIQAETGADISVDDDGSVGVVSVASVDSSQVAEAERQIKLILDPPTAEIGATYPGRVVNITKFGAFVNILPGRDGLLHISKIGGNRRIERVEDVLSLGDEVVVVVEDVDPNGKISLKPEGAAETSECAAGDTGGAPNRNGNSRSRQRNHADRDRQSRQGTQQTERDQRGATKQGDPSEPKREAVSFEDAFDAELSQQFDNLGPETRQRTRGSTPNPRGRR